MKKLLLLAVFTISLGLASQAQDSQTKVKKTSTAGQKVHNTFSKHKHHNGYKVKKEKNGVQHKTKVNTTTGEVKQKTDKDKK
jgi:opacity protein-like surface antigen